MQSNLELFGTLGPACKDIDTLSRMLSLGMTGIRLNVSHTSLKDSAKWLHSYQKAQQNTGISAKLLIDLQGPELRVTNLTSPLPLKEKEIYDISTLGLPNIINSYLKKGQLILLDDGKLSLQITALSGSTPLATVLRGGTLNPSKSIALPGITIDTPTLTASDIENLKCADDFGVSAVMLPFVRSKEDVLHLKKTLRCYCHTPIQIYSKIENRSGVEHLPEIAEVSDCIVIARGDLGNAYPLYELPVIQHQIAHFCQEHNCPFMVVTQLLASMEHSTIPTRAEVSDIFRAVQEGARQLMLTNETAVGDYPQEAMRYLCETARHSLAYLQAH